VWHKQVVPVYTIQYITENNLFCNSLKGKIGIGVFWILIRIGSGFNQVSVFGFGIRIQEGKDDPQFLVIKTLDPDWIWIRIGIQPKMIDPDPINVVRIRNTDFGTYGR
jgi:hypothetical protein